ncbi:hypothetical protein [Spirillospora sp. NPDC047279]|uniref:hypothetical protein n=1 Tax=Spirillospora sp. NPDC047279 TaxID=3155478 RepID=UPI0033F60AC1
MAHNTGCAKAQRPGCECDCGGARHGCQGAFEIAEASEDAVRTFMAAKENDWHGRRLVGLSQGQAAIGCAKADVVCWLHRDRALRECAKSATERAFEHDPETPEQGLVLSGLTSHLGSQRMLEFQEWARTTHFWCELLAQMAFALDHYERLRARMFRAVEDVLSQLDGPPPPDVVRRAAVIRMAVWSAWRYVLEGILAASGTGAGLKALLDDGNVQPLIWPIRVIAVLMCPDASCHPMVREHCWEPIVRHGGAEVRHEVRERLAGAFPGNAWSWQG